jgi:hypothetical protein
METYRPSKDYVYVLHIPHLKPCLTVASRGWHPLSYWYIPGESGPAAIAPIKWKSIPNDGILHRDRMRSLIVPDYEPWVRPPDTVYEAAGTDARVTPVPLALLLEMYRGARLEERCGRWIEFRLHRPEQAGERIGERGINALRRLAFIARNGELPPGVPTRIVSNDWQITPAGAAWLAAHGH